MFNDVESTRGKNGACELKKLNRQNTHTHVGSVSPKLHHEKSVARGRFDTNCGDSWCLSSQWQRVRFRLFNPKYALGQTDNKDSITLPLADTLAGRKTNLDELLTEQHISKNSRSKIFTAQSKMKLGHARSGEDH